MTEDELILTSILKISRSELYLQKPKLTQEQKKQFESYKARRQKNEPLQYILGVADFMGLELKVDSRVLIPRPETELLVDWALKKMKGQKARILDLGTGSGNIAIALAKSLSDSQVTSVDISQNALDLAKENALRHGVKDKIKFVCMDMVKYLSVETRINLPAGRQVASLHFDLIISNPPYVPDQQSLPMDVHQEPALALKAGKDGLKFYIDIIKYTPFLLRSGAYLMMEFGDGQELAVKKLLLEQKFSNIEILQDLAGKNRSISAQKL